jgi:PAS domain S-box-containing protein
MARGLRALIVDDDPEAAARLVAELERCGYSVEWERVATAETMRAALERQGWDIVFSELTLPGFTSQAALAMLRRREADLPFIVVSAGGRDQALAAIRDGASDFVAKDDLHLLGVAVERELRGAKSRRLQREAEAALRESEARFRRLAEDVPDIIFRYRLEPTSWLEYVSPAVTRLLGHTPEELRQGREQWMAPVHVEDQATLVRLTLGQIEAGRPVVVRCRTKEGREVRLEIHHSQVKDADGRVVALEGIARDITDRTELEQQLLVAQKMEALGRLAGGIAHDFKNLLTVIGAYAMLLLEELPEDHGARDELGRIRDATVHGVSLTNQLLDFSRRQVRELEVVQLNHVVDEVERMLRRVIGEDIELTVRCEPQLGSVEADHAGLEQIIMNLAINARDAMPRGGTLTIETANVELDEEAARHHVGVRPGPHAMLVVGDTGCGMDEPTLERIFEPFFTTKEKGTGLGLAMVYSIVRQSGGSITVDSEPGRGTTFRIVLPRATPEGVAARQLAEAQETGGSETILLVEDDDAVRRVAGRVLRGAGYTVLDAPGGEQAMQLAAGYEGTIDLLLTDIVMHAMSGFDLARSLAAERSEIRVLYMSGYADEALAHLDGRDFKTRYVQKPFTPRILLRKVRQALKLTPIVPPG